MDLAHTLALLRKHKPEIQGLFGETQLWLFGSLARQQSRDDSDVDLLVRFDGPSTSARYFGLQFYLEDLLGRPVDLVSDRALRSELRPFVERDAISV